MGEKEVTTVITGVFDDSYTQIGQVPVEKTSTCST